MLGNINILENGAFGYPGDDEYTVALGTTASIQPGDPVAKALGNGTGNVVALAGDNTPVVGTNYFAGFASSYSTETTSAAGKVKVTKFVNGTVYLGIPDAPTSWDTQAEYDALVGARVLFNATQSGSTDNYTFTVLATDSSSNGLVIMPLDVKKYPGRVAFAVRNGVNYLS